MNMYFTSVFKYVFNTSNSNFQSYIYIYIYYICSLTSMFCFDIDVVLSMHRCYETSMFSFDVPSLHDTDFIDIWLS